MTRIRAPTRRGEDWRRLLADPIRHWRIGYSAYELAHAWQSVTDFPPAVAAAFSTAPFGELELLFAFPEHRTRVPGRGFDSATDLFVLARTYAGELVTVAVEAKVAEGFDKPVPKWLTDPKGDEGNRTDRLGGLAELLGLDVPDLGEIAYQLLHRAAVPFLEARRLNAAHAVLLVHSFSADRAHIDEYRALARLFGASGGVGVVESIGSREGVERHLCWVADEPRPQAHQGEPEPVLLEALDWLRDTYHEHRFFKERDVEAVLQRRMTELFEERRSHWRVYENHRVPGKQLDLAVVDRHRPAEVALGVQLKYEPDHARAGEDMRGDTERFPVCLATEIKKDVQEIERCVQDGLIDTGYALLLDEAGYWRSRRTPPRGDCQLWGSDTKRHMAPAMFVNRAGAEPRPSQATA